MARHWAKLSLEHPTWGSAKGRGGGDESTVMGAWRITAQYDLWQFGERDSPWLKRDPAPTVGKGVGGAVVVQLGPDEFLIAGSNVRVRLGLAQPSSDDGGMLVRVEEIDTRRDGG